MYNKEHNQQINASWKLPAHGFKGLNVVNIKDAEIFFGLPSMSYICSGLALYLEEFVDMPGICWAALVWT